MKQTLRKEIELSKKAYSETDLHLFSKKIFQKLTQTKCFQDSKCILAYYSFEGEVFTHDFIERYANEKKIILPVVRKNVLVLKEYKGKHGMAKSDYGILEPVGSDFTDYSQIDLGIIPGVAFDRRMNRLGRGKGYYDRLLPLLSNTFLVGVGFSFQLKDSIYFESHDYPLDCVISEDEIVE